MNFQVPNTSASDPVALMEVLKASATGEVTRLEEGVTEKSSSSHSANIIPEMGRMRKKSESQKANRSEKHKKAKARDETAKAAKKFSIAEAMDLAQYDHFQPATSLHPHTSAAPLPTVMEEGTESAISCEAKMNTGISLAILNVTVDVPTSDEASVNLISPEIPTPSSNKASTNRARNTYSPTSKSLATKSTSHSKIPENPAKSRSEFDQHLDKLKCRRLNCGRMISAFDSSTVICPKCGPQSLIRYCSLNCLLDPDIRRHFHEECGGKPVPSNRTTDCVSLNPHPFNIRPFIHCAFETTERHRQAVYHSLNVLGGDYFIFDDLWVADNTSRDGGERGQVIAVCMFADNPNPLSPKERFQTALKSCLREGYMRHELVIGLVWMIVAWLEDIGQWSRTSNIAKELTNQIFREFSCKISKKTLDGFSGTVRYPGAICES